MFNTKVLRSVFLGFALVFIIAGASTPFIASAQTTAPAGKAESSIADILCTPEKDSKGKDLYICINKLYRVALVIGSIGAVLMIVVAGYLYISGGHEQISTAKSMIGTSIWGIIILIASYVLLRAINPALVEFKQISPGDIKNVALLTPDQFNSQYCTNWPQLCSGGKPIGNPTDVDNPGAGGVSKDHPENSCANQGNTCVDLKTAGVTCKNNCKAQKALADKLASLARAISPTKIIVTEAYPPTSSHSDGCHQTGACVDMAINPASDASWVQACTAATSAGLGYLNEIKDTPSVTGGCGKFRSGGSGDHLHLFLTQ